MINILKHKIDIALLLFLLAGCLTNCKKYPENTLWFKSPKKIYPFQGFIIKYEVNGVDSLDLLSTYYGSLPGLPHDIRQSKFITQGDKNDLETVFIHGNSGASSEVGVEFSKDKRKLYLSLSVSQLNPSYLKNFFFGKEWDILYLDKKGKLKITTKENGKTYLIEID